MANSNLNKLLVKRKKDCIYFFKTLFCRNKLYNVIIIYSLGKIKIIVFINSLI